MNDRTSNKHSRKDERELITERGHCKGPAYATIIDDKTKGKNKSTAVTIITGKEKKNKLDEFNVFKRI